MECGERCDNTNLELLDDEVDHLVIVVELGHLFTHVGERLVEDGKEHVDENVRHRDGVAEEEERTQQWARQLHREEVKSRSTTKQVKVRLTRTW